MRISKKLCVAVGTAIVDILIATSVIPVEAKTQAMMIVSSLAGIYIAIQGGIDAIGVKSNREEEK